MVAPKGSLRYAAYGFWGVLRGLFGALRGLKGPKWLEFLKEPNGQLVELVETLGVKTKTT